MITQGEWEAMRRVVLYALPDEERDYDEQVAAGEDTCNHIYHDFFTLARLVDRLRESA